jgi:hypothetical protein
MEGLTMTSRIASPLGAALGLTLLFGSTTAQASDPCVADAKQEYKEAKAQCKEDYQAAKDACLNRDHACVEGCRAGRAQCVDETNLDEDLLVCRDNLRAAKANCRATWPEGSNELDTCIDEAQVVAFLCRKDARTDAKPALRACRAGFRACAEACPPGSGSPDDVYQCKVDAKNAYLTCRSDARENFQAQKDLCRNRDHDCVEGCRAGRDGCREPFEDQLEADIAACNQTRKNEVDNVCPTDPDPEQCVIDANIAAFQCRDQAREDQRPNFEACRAGFQSCAQACPPAS